HDEFILTIRSLKQKPILIADAGFMYVAKMSGFAMDYDIFTPDLGELAYLADAEAPHPFYTRGFIFHMEDRVEELIKMAYKEGNAAQFMLVKGKTDYICRQGKILQKIDRPDIPELEAIGGNGDTITGMIAALVYKGLTKEKALEISAKANRIAGRLAHPTPATQISEIIARIPEALDCVGEIE
ncbi:MAG: sugar kinase, partial [Desulfobacterota bacterium]|nr:sugar kinase [Thermodesulfobacteriota bacterium]